MSSSKRKKERRQQRYERNVQKEVTHKKEAWENGKLIEENHNQGPYSVDYTIAVSERLYKYILQEKERALISETPDVNFIKGFRKYKMKIQDMILHWNPEVPKTKQYESLKKLLEVYWDDVVANLNFTSLINVEL